MWSKQRLSVPSIRYNERPLAHLLIENIAFVSTNTSSNETPSCLGVGSKIQMTLPSCSESTLSTMFILNDITPEQFSNFLWVFYNPSYSLYNTKSHIQWEGIWCRAEHCTSDSVINLYKRELSYIANQIDIDIDIDTNDIIGVNVTGSSHSTSYHSRSDEALPHSAELEPINQPSQPVHIPHPDHPYGQ